MVRAWIAMLRLPWTSPFCVVMIALHVLTSGSSANAADRVIAAKTTSAAGTFASRATATDAFKVLPENSELATGELLVALPGAALESKNGAVALKSLADYDGRSPLPILESALTLNEAKDVDLDVSLDRGRIDVTNLKADGSTVVRVRFWNQAWKLTLEGKGTRIALELCGRWTAGSRFKVFGKDSDKPEEPIASLVLLVVTGSAAVDLGGVTLGMKSPPGPALVEWDSVNGARPQPLKLEKLPVWADPDASLSPAGTKAAAAIEKFRLARSENASAALKAFLESTDPIEQRVALVTLGATDDLEPLGKALAAARSFEQWNFGITVIRHWLGRCPGNDQKLYQLLISPSQGYSPIHARTIMQLLFGFGADDLNRPETFEVLIEYLAHDQSPIRNLAAWHLVRLVPKGKAISFKPNGTKEECEAAYREWKKLIPAGTLPSAPKKE